MPGGPRGAWLAATAVFALAVVPLAILGVLRPGDGPPAAADPIAAARQAEREGADSSVAALGPEPVRPPAGAEANFVRGGRFVETFDGTPSSPEAFSSPAWSVNLSSRDPDTWTVLEAMDAHHGPGCEAPLATHEVSRYEDAVFVCADHLMTAVNASGYAVAYLTPHALVDFSRGEAVVRVDVSTFRASGRDWIDLWVTAFDDQMALPFNPGEGDVDLQGAPRNAVHLEMDRGCSGFRLTWYRDGRQYGDSPGCWGLADWNQVLVPDARRRDTLELRISRTGVRLWMPDYNLTLAEASVDLGFDAGVVQLGHHSYNPRKDCHEANSPMDAEDCAPTTWHWDNVTISPARPALISATDTRMVKDDSRVTFDHAAPRGAFLRFSAVGRVEVSFDGGRNWNPAQKQDSVLKGAYHPEHASSYWMPVPEGATSARFRFTQDGWYRGPFHARDFSIWSALAPQGVAAP